MESQRSTFTHSPLPPTEDLYGEILAAGAVVGSYVVHSLAREGGFAAVYRAQHMDTGKLVALKVLRRTLAASPRMLARFQQEAEAVQRIGHPNIVEILDFEVITPGRPYIAMEWLEGRNLLEELRLRGSFSAREALDIMEQISNALASAHAHGVIHRDLKANNIMAVPRGSWFHIKLIDFGIAKLTDPNDQHTTLTTRTIIGTPETMAPEQIQCHETDARTDIYAMGLLLYQLVCGRLPFVGESAIDVEQMHLYAMPPRVSDTAPVNAAFDAVVERALQKQKEHRYASVSEFIEALRQAVAAEPALALMPIRNIQPGIGVYIDVQLAPSDAAAVHQANEEALGHAEMADLVDEVLDNAEELMHAAGLEAGVFGTSSALLGVALLPPEPMASTVRANILHTIIAHHRQWSAARGSQQRLCIRITAHAAEVEVEEHAAQKRLSRGELLKLGHWPSSPPIPGVFASAAAVAGIEQHFRLVPVTSAAELFLLEPTS